MARARNAKVEEALALYRHGLKLKEIAEKLGVPEGTVRRWKSSFGWDGKKNAATMRRESERKEKNVRNNSERSLKTFAKNNERSKRSEWEANASEMERKAAEEDVCSVLNTTELDDKQRLFCLYYARCHNATKAYQKAYECSYMNACGHGSNLLKRVEVRNEINRLKQDSFTRALLTTEDITQKHIDIAFADITDFLTFGVEEIPLADNKGNPIMTLNPETGEVEQVMRKRSFVAFKDASEVDGTLIQEVRQGRDGVVIKLMDRQKSLDWLSEHMGMLTPEQKARVDKLKCEMQAGKQEGASNLADVIISAYEEASGGIPC